MRLRVTLLTLSLYLAFVTLGCTSKPAAPDNSNNNAAHTDAQSPANGGTMEPGKEPKEHKEHKEAREVKKEPLIVPSGTSVTISLTSSLGSKLSQADQTFTGVVAKGVVVDSEVAIPEGTKVSGTVTDAKPLGKFAGGAVLTLRLDSVSLNGVELPVQAGLRTFSAKGKGKRTAVIAGGGAALGGIIGALAGGGKGAAIGLAAGGGAGAGGAALTGNKDIVLPAESAVTFELSQSLEVKR